jgi:hypothetical protein
MPDTGYGSATFQRACDISRACRGVEGSGPRATWRRLQAGSVTLTRYRRSLPSVTVQLTSSTAGRMIGEHFAIREEGRWRYRGAQAVLRLPADFSDYMRGRHRQAVRTNNGHARKAGLRVESCAIDNWAPGSDDSRIAQISPGPVERWFVVDPDGVILADSIVSIDEAAALLQGLVSFAPYARWLLHTAIVERLCGCCSVLLVNSDDAYLLGQGTWHFQRLLGYEIARLRLSRSARAAEITLPPHPAGLSWPPGRLSWKGVAAESGL